MSTTLAPETFLSQFGLASFRHGQKEVISTVMSGQDCLCVMPTGGGKSLCYQLPAVALDGLTLVVSPLIALMKDQVDQLESLGLPVSFVNSTLSVGEQYARLDRMAAGEFRLVYVAPERFRSGRFLEAVRAAGVKLLAVDEAHCISEWGHDFRPDYAKLGYFRRILGNPPTLALTATATDRVRRDIIEQLALNEPKTYITGFARPNLFYEVQSPRSERDKPELLVKFLRQTPGSGIIYTSTRKRAQEVADAITSETKRKTVVYHAGLLPEDRRTAQEDFMTGRREIVVATNAFGMGIDKSDVRFVVHYNLPGSLEAYYQEAGRAGRDGLPSRCLMLYHAADRYIQNYFIDSAYPGRDIVQTVYEYFCEIESSPIEMTQDELKKELNLPIGSDGVGNCEQILESAGVLERLIASQNMATVRIDNDLPTLVDLLPKQAKTQRKVLQSIERLVGERRQELVQFNFRELTVSDEFDHASITYALRELNKLDAFTYVPPFRGRAIRMIERNRPFDELEIDFEALERRKAQEYEKLNVMIRFAMSGTCRQREILRYFGEENAAQCGHCDNCRPYNALRPLAGHDPGMDGSPRPLEEGLGTAADGSITDSASSADAPADPKILEAIRMVLSGVARAQSRFPCGKNLIAQMLCGSNNAKVLKLRFNKLSTFGLLKHLTQSDVLVLIESLIALGCLQQTKLDKFRPVLEVTELGVEVMKGQASLSGSLPIPADLQRKLRGRQKAESESERGSGKSDSDSQRSKSDVENPSFPCSPASSSIEPDPEIIKALRQWRGDVADEAGVPLHYILSNDTMAELALVRPKTLVELVRIKGIGPVKAARYGMTLLEVVGEAGETKGSNEEEGTGGNDECRVMNDELSDEGERREAEGGTDGLSTVAFRVPNPQSPIADLSVPHSSFLVPPSHYWTQRLLTAGFTVDECVAIRGLSREVILEHVRLAEREP